MAPTSRSANGASRNRRPTAEVRQLMLDAARSLFASKGYANTTTREVAQLAGVSESLLYRHFGTKAVLFDQAILEPFKEFASGYRAKWEAWPTTERSPQDLATDFIEGLYDLLKEHREIAIALVAAFAFEDEVTRNGTESPLSAILVEVERVAAQEIEARGFVGIDLPVTIRAISAMVMGMATMDAWFFPPGRRKPSRSRIVNEMIQLVVHGLTHRPQP